MRVALVVHAFPPEGNHGVENHTRALARALAAAEGCSVEVLAPRNLQGFARGSQRREVREGYGVTWLQADAATTEQERLAALRAFLERERPDVVHFQHLLGFGPDALRVPAELGLPCLHTAHDFHPAHATWTLVQPDLEPFACGDDEAQARTLRAQAFLDRVPSLGDHHGAVLPGQLGEASEQTLRAILAGEREDGLPEARAHVRLRGQRFRDGFAHADARLATSRTLAQALTAALGRAVEFEPSGIECERFAGLEPVRVPGAGAPLRIGFLGGLLKHKGVHVLLEAFERMTAEAELHVHGASRDAVYTRLVRERAAAAGAQVHGGYRAEELPGLLEGLDVVCVPSLWSENAPYVIREAQAAGRVLVVADTPALRESFEEGQGGLFVPQGDAPALARALDRLASEEGLLASLAASVRAPLRLEEEVERTLVRYRELVARAAERRPRPVVPASVEPVRRLHEELAATPTRELFERVLRGLGRLATCVGVEQDPTDLLAQVVGSGSPTRDLVLDRDRELRWLRETVASLEEERDEQARRADWQEAQAGEARRRASWAEERAEAGDRTEGVERDWLRETLADLEKERDWLKGQQEEAEAARAWLRATLDGVTREADWLRQRDEQRTSELESLEQERTWLAEQRDAARAEADWLRDDAESARAEAAWLREQKDALEAEAADRREADEEREAEATWLREDGEAVRRENAWLRGRAEGAEAEAQTLASQRAEAERSLDVLREERDWLQGLLETRREELRWLREQLTGEAVAAEEDPATDGAAIQAATEALHGELAAVRRHAAWLHAELAELVRGLGTKVGGSDLEPAEALGPEAAPRLLESLRGALDRARAELGWRRAEMAAARAGSDRLLARLAVPGLAERLRSWAEAPGAVAPGAVAPSSPAQGGAPAAPESKSREEERP